MGLFHFGTDGWRGEISRDITFDNLACLAAAFADMLKDQGLGDQQVAVGYDRRFLSERYAEEMARVIAARGVPVLLSTDHCPTPCVSFAILYEQASAGIVVTASSSPPEWNGVKLRAEYGGPASAEMCAEVASRALALRETGERPALMDLEEGERMGRIVWFDPRGNYIDHIMSRVDWRVIRNTGLRVVVDTIFGAGSGFADYVLERIGLRPLTIRQTYTPGFERARPDPIPKHLHALQERVQAEEADIGFAVDGDADRVGFVDEYGDVVGSQHIMALLLRHLVEDRGMKGRVIKSISASDRIERMCERYKLPCVEVGVGFRPICQEMRRGGVLLGCEESGGFGMAGHIPERDGILVALMILEMMALSKKSLSELVTELDEDYKGFVFERLDLEPGQAEIDRALALLRDSPPDQFGDRHVESVTTTDGHKFRFREGGWLMIRASGTEPILRVYAEADSPESVQALLEAAQAYLGIEE